MTTENTTPTPENHTDATPIQTIREIYPGILDSSKNEPTSLTLEEAHELALQYKARLPQQIDPLPNHPQVQVLAPYLMSQYISEIPAGPKEKTDWEMVLHTHAQDLIQLMQKPRSIESAAINTGIFLAPVLDKLQGKTVSEAALNNYAHWFDDPEFMKSVAEWNISMEQFFKEYAPSPFELRESLVKVLEKFNPHNTHAFNIRRFQIYEEALSPMMQSIDAASAQMARLLSIEHASLGLSPEQLSTIPILIHDGMSVPDHTLYDAAQNSLYIGTSSVLCHPNLQETAIRHEIGHGLAGRFVGDTQDKLTHRISKAGVVIERRKNNMLNEAITIGFANHWPVLLEEKNGPVTLQDILEKMTQRDSHVPMVALLEEASGGTMDGFRELIRLATTNDMESYTEIQKRTHDRKSPFFKYSDAQIEHDPVKGYVLTHVH